MQQSDFDTISNESQIVFHKHTKSTEFYLL